MRTRMCAMSTATAAPASRSSRCHEACRPRLFSRASLTYRPATRRAERYLSMTSGFRLIGSWA